MDALKILIIFLIMLVLIFKFRRGLSLTFALGCVCVAVAYGFAPAFALSSALRTAFSTSTFSIVAIFYTVTFLQKMMESTGHVSLAESSLLGLTNNRRLSAEIAPLCVGLMPSPAAVVIGGGMVESIYKDDVSNEDKNFITSYFRHIPESFAPIYSAIVLSCELAQVRPGDFVLHMLPLAALLLLLGHFMFMRGMPWQTGQARQRDWLKNSKKLFLSLWPVLGIIIVVLATDVDVYLVTIGVIVLYYVVNRFRFRDIVPFFTSAFDRKIIVSTVFILIFKDYIMSTDAVETLPRLFAQLPLPDYLVFSLIFFVGAVIVGNTAIAAIGIPLAYAAMPDGGVALLVLLTAMGFAAMQVSISHICLFLCSAYFKVEVSSLIRRTAPVIAVFCALAVGYYLMLR